GGGFSGQSAFYVDGVQTTVAANNANSVVPTQDSVREFRVSTNNVSAEFGGFAGGVVNMTTRSGTNDLHGTFYEYLTNKVINANRWPAPNQSGIVNNFIVTAPTSGDQKQYSVRGDRVIGSKQQLFLRYMYWNVASAGTDPWGTKTGQPKTGTIAHTAVAGDT